MDTAHYPSIEDRMLYVIRHRHNDIAVLPRRRRDRALRVKLRGERTYVPEGEEGAYIASTFVWRPSDDMCVAGALALGVCM